jgi:hypothetical protein
MKTVDKEVDKQKQNLVCQRCTHEWNYKGYNPYFTLCTRCRTTVRIRRNNPSQSPVVGSPIGTATSAQDTNKAIPPVKNPLKRAYLISDRTLVVIAEEIVKRLGITEDTWFEQQEVDDGVMLKMKKFSA